MSQDDTTQIKVGKHSIGIVGLTQVIEEVAEDFARKSDFEIQAELLSRLSRSNYIPSNIQDTYANAFLREFKKYIGKPYEEEVSEGLEIKVLGPGCSQCDMLDKILIEVLSEMNILADMEHVRDIKEIGKYGVMGTPALVINGKVVSVGKVPGKEKLKPMLSDFLRRNVPRF
ncbi:MAG: thioredoxin family protein [Deltaproteobacteria bacterium]|jgi:small redox-active disulfide protein 2|nr:thioredoxin family protein [Deltaproteobacteria bacterium]